MRMWKYLALPASLPFIALACGDTGWSEDLDFHFKCVCGVGTPEEFAECIELGYPPDPETCPPDAGTVGCPGVCAPETPAGFEGPVLVATGPAIGLPLCPLGTKEVIWALADPQLGPRDCPTCVCGEPPGTCEFPTSWDTHTTVCQAPTPPVSGSFDAPANWDGSCTTANALSEGKLCGGVPCVRSLSVAPPVVVEGDCPVLGEEPTDLPIPYGGTINEWPTPFSVAALACANDGKTPCKYASCSPEPPSSFEVCVYATGDVVCPQDWTKRSVFFEGGTDNRECSACTCSPPTGGSCTVQIHVYTDSACTNEQLSPYVSSDMSAPCYDLMSGISLGSKKAEVIERLPGTCSPQGGESTGEIEMEKPITFCCLS